MSDIRAEVVALWSLEARYRAMADVLRETATALEAFAETDELATERASVLERGGEWLSEAAKTALSGGGQVRPVTRHKKTDRDRLRPFLDQIAGKTYE